jgi:hypothetical protein
MREVFVNRSCWSRPGRSSINIAFPSDQHETRSLVSATNLITSHLPLTAREIWAKCRCYRSLLTLSSTYSGSLILGISCELQWLVPSGHLNITRDSITTLNLHDTDMHMPSRSHGSTPCLAGSVPELPTERSRTGAPGSINRAEDLKSYAIHQAKLRLRWNRTPERREPLIPLGTFNGLGNIWLLPGGDVLCFLFYTGDISLNRINVSPGSPALVCMSQHLSGHSHWARHQGWVVTSTTPYVLFTTSSSPTVR